MLLSILVCFSNRLLGGLSLLNIFDSMTRSAASIKSTASVRSCAVLRSLAAGESIARWFRMRRTISLRWSLSNKVGAENDFSVLQIHAPFCSRACSEHHGLCFSSIMASQTLVCFCYSGLYSPHTCLGLSLRQQVCVSLLCAAHRTA